MTILHWDTGTAFDFLISLFVLHNPADFGLRPTWTAGVRQRLSASSRECFEKYISFSHVPLDWLTTLANPKDVNTLLHALVGLSNEKRLAALTLNFESTEKNLNILSGIGRKGSWSEADQDYLRMHYLRRGVPLKPTGLNELLKAWAEVDTFSSTLLSALEEYQRVFFAEEENRIRPALAKGLVQAQELAKHKSVEELVEYLSRGVRLQILGSLNELTLIASYWTTPISFVTLGRGNWTLMAFGVRPGTESVAPGAQAGDGLVSTLKCLADPTRLRILRYLSDTPLTPTELANRLRLRTPTVIHHLQSLRLAGLVQVLVGAENERRYIARLETVKNIQTALLDFIKPEN